MTITLLCRRAVSSAALAVLPAVPLAVPLFVLLPVRSAQAELGGTMADTQPAAQISSQPRSPASLQTPKNSPVTLLNGTVLRRTSLDAGRTTVNEYATNTGQIFAYTWQGPTMPDLPTLLGPYNASYRAGASEDESGTRDLHASRVARPDIVVESGGQMRSYVGRAWLPAALPAGVTPDDLH